MSEGIEWSALLGAHELSGAEEGYAQRNDYYGRATERPALHFVLDGVTYSAIEDDNDGYRSACEGIYLSQYVVKNTFAPVAVVGIHRTKASGHYGEDDVIELHDAATGALVLEVGTSNIDDYYPGFVGYFYPEAMAINKEAE